MGKEHLILTRRCHSANTAHPTPPSHSKGVSPTRPGQSTLQSVGAAMSCWLGGRAEQGFSSCRSQLQPQATLDTGITLLLWPDAMHEELRFQQASHHGPAPAVQNREEAAARLCRESCPSTSAKNPLSANEGSWMAAPASATTPTESQGAIQGTASGPRDPAVLGADTLPRPCRIPPSQLSPTQAGPLPRVPAAPRAPRPC